MYLFSYHLGETNFTIFSFILSLAFNRSICLSFAISNKESTLPCCSSEWTNFSYSTISESLALINLSAVSSFCFHCVSLSSKIFKTSASLNVSCEYNGTNNIIAVNIFFIFYTFLKTQQQIQYHLLDKPFPFVWSSFLQLLIFF